MMDITKQILNSKNSREIEELTKKLSLEEVKTLLEHIEMGEFQEGLLSFIQGLSPAHFAVFSDRPLFQKFVKTGTLQEKLYALIEHFHTLYSQYKEEGKVLDECINELPLFPIPSNLLSTVCEQIVQLSDKTTVVMQLLDHALKLAWLSEKTNLIEAFSNLKNYFAELSHSEYTQPEKLMSRLNSIYGADDSSSVEGLPALGINYVEDLKQLSYALGKDISNLPENNLLPAIHDRLISSGLSTVADLKKNKIYTKDHLFAYLNKLTKF